MKKRHFIKGLLFVILALIFFLFQFLWDISSYFNPEQIQNWLALQGSLAPVIFILIMAIAVVVSPIPSLPLDIAAGAFFGPLLGTVYSVVGALGGAVVSFTISRFVGREFVERFLGGHINFCIECSDKLLTKIVFFSRLLPIVSFDFISYGAGLTKMSLKKFSLATALGMIPLTFIYNYFGSALVIGRGLTILAGLIMVILFFLIPRWIERNDLFSLRRVFQHDQEHSES
ncbi:MAG: TVP38/TMEM64 family protein [Nitrospiraceae bacterium]|nr:MAG: TVP38/TMEM64 family protein [Nitrospiraceae bacterium]